ncbi:imidazolonepropionase-like amidohydrolase [Flavobacterium sp. PL11]|jgi:imidazolonepropionase-like amidohydrolase|uniref:metal-dependent hydrolase family protein n=1 Tax=Flavobacterium sp. PL11 TaxID=3071717 RepID=UPI002DFD24F5|nr:imidazolonepropionase-like amidohydrolase [Flavobacterium sp. PL11]
MKPTITCVLVSLFFSTAAFSQDYYLYCGKMLNTITGKELSNQTIVISNNKIVKIAEGFVPKSKAADIEIDLKSKYVLPGLIDLHVHIEGENDAKSYMSKYLDNEADIAFQAVRCAEITLLAGFTTVRDLGGTGVNISIRNAINKGIVKGPRIYTAGKAIATTGGHADPTNGSNRKLVGDPGPHEGVINSPEEAVKAVRERYKEGADVIKITATGGVLSVAKSGKNPQFSLEEIKAITTTAKDYNMLTAAHAHGDEGMQRAILGGIKTIEHGTFMSEETMELMKKYDSYLVPTLTAGKEVEIKAEIQGYYPDIVVPKAKEVGPQIKATFAKAYKKGVKIAFGTDAGVFAHGSNAKEFGYMVEAGMPALAAIQSATTTNAMLLGLGNDVGQLKEGFLADIIAVNESPLTNIKTLEKVVFVMKNGTIYKN